MPRATTTQLLQRVAELEAENAALLASRLQEPIETPASSDTPRRRSRSWGWALLATVLIVIGSLLAPVAVVASWAKVELTDTDRFVAAYAPLARDTAVRQFVTDQTVAVITQQVDIPQLTSEVIDGITELGTGPAATRALEMLKGPAARGIESLITSTVARFVSSEQFANVWGQALRISHSQLVAAMRNDPGSAVNLAGNGEIGIQLGPIIAEVKQVLVAQGLGFAEQIPAVDRTVVIAQSDALPTIQLGYGIAVAAGAWLPWVSLLFLVAGVLVARRRAVAAIWAAAALALTTGALLAGLGIARIVALSSISPSLVPADTLGVLLDAVLSSMRSTAVAVVVLSLAVAVAVWCAGPFSVPRRLRALFTSGATWLRAAADRRGLSTGRVGTWLFAQRVLVRAAVAVIAATVVLITRPLTPAVTIWTLLLSALAIAVLELVQRPDVEPIAVETTIVVELD